MRMQLSAAVISVILALGYRAAATDAQDVMCDAVHYPTLSESLVIPPLSLNVLELQLIRKATSNQRREFSSSPPARYVPETQSSCSRSGISISEFTEISLLARMVCTPIINEMIASNRLRTCIGRPDQCRYPRR